MKAYINDQYKMVYVLVPDIPTASRLTLWLGYEHRDLIDAGWVVVCHGLDSNLRRKDRREENVQGVASLADAIRKGAPCTHSCPHHPEREAAG